MAPIIKIKEIGRGLKPKGAARGVNGKQSVRPTISRVVASKYFPELLLKKGFLLLITSTIMDAEMTDSINQPVLNCSVRPGKRRSRTPKVSCLLYTSPSPRDRQKSRMP